MIAFELVQCGVVCCSSQGACLSNAHSNDYDWCEAPGGFANSMAADSPTPKDIIVRQYCYKPIMTLFSSLIVSFCVLAQLCSV